MGKPLTELGEQEFLKIFAKAASAAFLAPLAASIVMALQECVMVVPLGLSLVKSIVLFAVMYATVYVGLSLGGWFVRRWVRMTLVEIFENGGSYSRYLVYRGYYYSPNWGDFLANPNNAALIETRRKMTREEWELFIRGG